MTGQIGTAGQIERLSFEDSVAVGGHRFGAQLEQAEFNLIYGIFVDGFRSLTVFIHHRILCAKLNPSVWGQTRGRQVPTSENFKMTRPVWFSKAFIFDVFLVGAFCCCLVFLAIADIRITAHHAITFDDYGGYLEYLITGGAEGAVPTTPWRERIGGVIAYIPFTIFPPIPFGGGQGTMGDRAYLYHAIILGNMVYMSPLSLSMLYLKQEQKLLYVLMAVLFSTLVGFKGVAVLGFCFVFAIVLTHKRNFIIPALLMIIGMTVAEKVVLTVGAYFGAIIVLHARDHKMWDRLREKNLVLRDLPWRYLLFVALSGVLIIAYLYVRAEYGNYITTDTPLSVDPLHKVTSFLSELLSLRGLLLIAPAPMMLVGVCYFSLDRDAFIRISIVLAVLTIASLQGELGITIGRVLLYTMPLIVYEYMQMNGFRLSSATKADALPRNVGI